MKLELSIADDRELRNFIKDSIKSEIVSIARGEVKGILVDVIKEGYIPKSQSDIDKIVREEINSIIRNELKSSDYYGNNNNKLKEYVTDAISNILKEAINSKIAL
jgi:hypothetical protein